MVLLDERPWNLNAGAGINWTLDGRRTAYILVMFHREVIVCRRLGNFLYIVS